MKAEVIKDFRGCAEGEIYPRTFRKGETITGSLARSMIDAGYAKSLGGAPENKMLDGAQEVKNSGGPTGEDKSSSLRPAGRAKGAKTSKPRRTRRKSS